MQDLIQLLIAFVLGFFMKYLLGTVCQSRLVEGSASVDMAMEKIEDTGASCVKANTNVYGDAYETICPKHFTENKIRTSLQGAWAEDLEAAENDSKKLLEIACVHDLHAELEPSCKVKYPKLEI